MRILLIATAALVATATTAAAQDGPRPIQTIELPPSNSVVDPFAPKLPAIDSVTDGEGSVADEAASVPAARIVPPTEVRPVDAETETAIGRVDAIMTDFFGKSPEEERAIAAKLYAEQMERDKLEAQRVDTLNREARERVEAENARRVADYQAEVERINTENELRMTEWRARVAACEAGDRAACQK